jgi:hypothetical protein
MESRFSEESHAILEKEFSRLGFNYQDIIKNGINDVDEIHSELFGIFFLDRLPPEIDGMTVSFIIKNSENGKPPHIDSMSASLFKEVNLGEFQRIVRNRYSSNEKKLPTIEQLRKELSSSLMLLNSFGENLINEFDKLGFNLNEFAGNATYIDESLISLNDEERNKEIPNRIKVIYSFLISQSQTNLKYSIEQILVNVIDSKNNKILSKKEFYAPDHPLPTRKQILNEIMENINAELANTFISIYTELDSEFKRYGFDKDMHNILFDHEISVSNGLCVFFKINEKIDLPKEKQPQHIDFIVGAFLRQTYHYYKIENINVILYGESEMLPLHSRKYNISDGPLPSKNQIYTDLERSLRIKDIREKFCMDEKRKEQGFILNPANIKRGL